VVMSLNHWTSHILQLTQVRNVAMASLLSQNQMHQQQLDLLLGILARPCWHFRPPLACKQKATLLCS
jgi:hypothetical protein